MFNKRLDFLKKLFRTLGFNFFPWTIFNWFISAETVTKSFEPFIPFDFPKQHIGKARGIYMSGGMGL